MEADAMGKTQASRTDRQTTLDCVAADWRFFRTNAMLTEDSGFRKALNAIRRAASDCEQTYAIIGAIALSLHGYRRFTEDIDVLISPVFAEFLKANGSRYELSIRGETILLIQHQPTGVQIDAVIQGRKPVDTSAYVFPDPAEVAVGEDRVVDLATLINLKLAVNRVRDFADVVELIKRNPDAKDVHDQIHPSLGELYEKAVHAAEAELRGGIAGEGAPTEL